MNRFIEAWKAFFNVLSGRTAQEVRSAAPQKRTQENKPESIQKNDTGKEFESGCLYTLTLLQREARLVDFLMEDITPYDDEQVGAAVRQIHDLSAKTLKQYFQIAPLLDQEENTMYKLSSDFQPELIQVTGNVPDMQTGASAEGTLRHKGWKAAKITLPLRNTAKKDQSVICPAEMEF